MSQRPRIIGSLHGVLQRANTINEAELARRSSCTSIGSMSEQIVVEDISSKIKCDSNNNLLKSTASLDDSTDETEIYPKSFAWDWPFCDEGIARGVYTAEKFLVCLPFNSGGTGEKNGSTKKFEKISECNFSWTIGLSNSSNEFGGTSFWRMELEIIRNLNMLALIVSRDISRYESGPKRLKRVRKVYRSLSAT
uniref:Uncharacterized protein n=1 Tax=Panagrolaimus superbus TaxID=310955 RepID=A0A914Y6I5_9BILA